ncbi:MAG TPA: citrate/2-methylcitrate synthase [bacterium]|nr:citrate/2-methylcitrate synthase [bacterium]
MRPFVGKDTRVLIQGITGRQGTKVCREMLDYGTHVVAGVTPGKIGHSVHGVPVYSSVEEALKKHPEINTSLITVPRDAALAAAFEVIPFAQIRLVNVLTEGIPQQDSARMVQLAREHRVWLVGPASVGIIAPGEHLKIGAIGGNDPGVFYPGPIALFSKSGGMCLSIATELFNRLGYGNSLVVGIGGDRITGTTFVDLLELVRDDETTQLVIIMGEVGGTYEENAADYIRRTKYPKPVVVRLTGIGAQNLFPKGTRMGHAGAIIGEERVGTFQSKVEAFESIGVPVAKTSDELADLVEKAMPQAHVSDLESAVAGEMELVSISKTKLESLKSQVRAVQVRTSMTQLIGGIPYFRGYLLTDLVQRATIPDMVWMTTKRRDTSRESSCQIQQDLLWLAEHCPLTEKAIQSSWNCQQDGGRIETAISTGLLAQKEPDLQQFEGKEIRTRYSDDELLSLIIGSHVIALVSHLMEHPTDQVRATSLAELIGFALKGEPVDDKASRVLQAIFVACVDHTPATPSSLAALAAYSGGSTLKNALASGISAMGHVHAGAGEATAQILQDYLKRFRTQKPMVADGIKIETIQGLAEYIVDKYTGVLGGEKRKLPGFGHRYYSLYRKDPRAESVMQITREMALDADYVNLAHHLEESLKMRKSPGLCLNVDGVIGVVLSALGLPPKTGKALFIIPRTFGIVSQLLEQEAGSFFRLANESVLYVGPDTGRTFE